MATPKIWRCCMCGRVLTEYKPIRLAKQLYGIDRRYAGYKNVEYYDFCESCYRPFEKWIEKYRKENNNE